MSKMKAFLEKSPNWPLMWADLRSIPATELEAGDRWYAPALGEVYRESLSGEVAGGLYLNGTVWTVESVDPDGTINATAGEREVCAVPEGYHRVLVIVSKP